MNPVYRLADVTAEMAAFGASLHHVGCFCACLDASSDEAVLNYAVPWVSPWSFEQVRLAVARLGDLFESHGRPLRVQFVEEAWPWLAGLLEQEGLTRERAVELMVCARQTFRPAPQGPVHLISADDAEGIAGFSEVECEVFPEDAPGPALVRYQIEQGFWRCAVARVEDKAAAAGALAPMGRIAELAAMATLPEMRRRGLGSAIASALVEAHFSGGGDLVWLALGSGAAAPMYSHLGFRRAGFRVSYLRRR